MNQSPALRLAIVDDYAVVVAGVAALLADEHIDVVETGASQTVLSDVDVVLYDTFAQVQGRGIDLEDFVRDSSGAKVVVYSWNVKPEMADGSLPLPEPGVAPRSIDARRLEHPLMPRQVRISCSLPPTHR